VQAEHKANRTVGCRKVNRNQTHKSAYRRFSSRDGFHRIEALVVLGSLRGASMFFDLYSILLLQDCTTVAIDEARQHIL
jgi:hypothetical protein